MGTYKIVRVNTIGRKTTIRRGFATYESASDRACDLEQEMIENCECEARGGSLMEYFDVEEED